MTKPGVGHGYILKGKTFTKLDDPKGKAGTTFANSIQYNGTAVVGGYTNSAGITLGFLYKGGKFTDVPGPKGNAGSSAISINDLGHIVGIYTDSAGVDHPHGYLLKGGKYTALNVPGAIATVATGVNNKDVIVLYWAKSSTVSESSIYNGKTYKTINVPGAASSFAIDLDNEGDVILNWLDSAGLYHGALLHAGRYKFNYPKAYGTFPAGLNDKSMFVGSYVPTKGANYQGFKATFK